MHAFILCNCIGKTRLPLSHGRGIVGTRNLYDIHLLQPKTVRFSNQVLSRHHTFFVKIGTDQTCGQTFLFGTDIFLHSADFNNTFNFKVLYKTFSNGATSDFPLQFTFVWGMQDLFGVKGLRFSGFADIWGENVVNFMEGATKAQKYVFISEPQIWYNIGQHLGIPNLHIGSEVELSMNFAGYDGFYARPCFGTKWVF